MTISSFEDSEDAFEPLEVEAQVRRGSGPIGKREKYRFVEDPEKKDSLVIFEEGDWSGDYYLVNPLDYPRGRYPMKTELFHMWFGQIGSIHLLVWAKHFEEAFEEAAGWLEDMGLKGYFVDDEHLKELYEEALKEILEESGKEEADEEDEQAAQEQAEVDLTYTESGYVPSDEWGGQEAYNGLYAAALYASAILYEEQYGEED